MSALIVIALHDASMNAAGTPTLSGSTRVMALVAANLYGFCFGFSWGLVVWVMLGEMFNNKIRAAALSVATAAQWIANLIVSTTFLPLLQSFSLVAAYGLYTIAAAISFFFVLLLLKETKGIELEAM